MKNIHNVNIFNTSLEEVLKLALCYKDEQRRLRKKTKDYPGLKAAFESELYIEGGVVKTRPTTKDAKE